MSFGRATRFRRFSPVARALDGLSPGSSFLNPDLEKFFLLRSSSLRSSLRDKGRPRARRGDVHDEDAHLADVSFH